MKKTDTNLLLLQTIFVISIVIANIVGCKVIDIGASAFGMPLLLSGGAITYAFTFLCTDIIGEIWGRKEANRAVVLGFIGQVFAIGLIVLTQYTPTQDNEMQSAYETLLGQSPIFTLGSLVAYLCSQSWDVWIFHNIRGRFSGKPKMRWLWNNASTITSQIIDTFIYAVIAFGIGMNYLFTPGGFSIVLSIFLGQYILKFTLALLDTPIFYILTNNNQTKIETSCIS